MSLICVKDIRKVYRVDQERVVALNRINLNIEHGEICCILGTSGSGKSTLLNIMAGLEKPTKGAVLIDGQDIAQMSERQLALFRQLNIGFIFQSYNLMPTMTAMENVALPLMFKGVGRRERMKEAKRMLKRVNLGSRLSHKPTQMSGGQQQRVGIARAFVAKPKIVFADEPTGNLDSKTTIEVMEMIVRMARKYHETLILVTHDQEIAEYADRIVHLVDGNIVSDESNQSLIRADEKAEDGKAAGESVEKNVDLAGETAE
ncbi:MAG: ABC transporter ATP-binding protein [Candidatus Merdivicinus sp.]